MSRGKLYSAEQIIKILREVDIYSGQGKPMTQNVWSSGILNYDMVGALFRAMPSYRYTR